MYIDAFGKPCPMPLVMAKKELDTGCEHLSIAVDNDTAVENLTHLANTKNCASSVTDIEGGFLVTFDTQDRIAVEGSSAPKEEFDDPDRAAESGYAVFIGKDHVGEGDPALGSTLMSMALYTLAESDDVPVSLLFMNAGVKLPAGSDGQVQESLATLIAKGTRVLVCGACLDFYGLKEALAVGTISNMYEILDEMKHVGRVITL